jgi:hypothetical protein
MRRARISIANRQDRQRCSSRPWLRSRSKRRAPPPPRSALGGSRACAACGFAPRSPAQPRALARPLDTYRNISSGFTIPLRQIDPRTGRSQTQKRRLVRRNRRNQSKRMRIPSRGKHPEKERSTPPKSRLNCLQIPLDISKVV